MAQRQAVDAPPGRRPADQRRTGAHQLSERGGRKKRGGWLWPLLALLGLLLLIGLLLLALSGSDDQDKAGGAPGNTNTLTASGKSLLPVPGGGLKPFVGQTAEGKALQVVSVNGNEGFSIAKGGGDPLYVEWGGDVGRNEGSSFKPKKGDTVDLTGPVEKAGPDAAERLKLDTSEARLVESQGAFVNADRVTKSK